MRPLAGLLAAAAVAAPGVLATTAASAADGATRPMWDTRLFARVPAPGYPAHAYPHPNGRVYEGTYVSTGSTVPSRVSEYAGDGTVLRQWQVPGQDLVAEHGVQVATSDAQGRLVLLDHTPPRILLLDPRDGRTITYATFPDGSIPNYAAWGPDAELYVTDYGRNVVWRVPPGGGTPQLWLQDPLLSAVEFGTTGIALAADRRSLLLAQQTVQSSADPLAGALFRVAIADGGRPGPLQRVWTSHPLDLPDGFAIGRDGRIYVATLGPNQIVVVRPDGSEQERWPPVPLLGDNGTSVPFDALSSVAFRGTSLITASQSNPRGEAEHWALHDVEVRADGLPELIPRTAGVLPGEIAPGSALTLRARPARLRAGVRTRLRFTVTAGKVPVPDARVAFAGTQDRTDAAGRVTLTVTARFAGVRTATATRSALTSGRLRIRVRR